MWARIDGLRVLELGTPGAMRQRLNQLVIARRKTATAGLLSSDYRDEDEPLESVGEELVLVDDHTQPVARVQVTSVEVVPFGTVSWEFADAEGEGFTSIDDWRAGHRRFWTAGGEQVDDSTEVVCLRLRLASSVTSPSRRADDRSAGTP